jgi:hypothetical protein
MRLLAILKPNGEVIRDPDWYCVGDVMRGFHGFPGHRSRDYGILVDAETLTPVYPEDQLMDGEHTGQTSHALG